MRYGKSRKTGLPTTTPLSRVDRWKVLRDAHLVWALNEKIYDDETGEVFQTFESCAYHIGMARLYNDRINSCLSI